MRKTLLSVLCASSLLLSSLHAYAAPAQEVLGKDYTFPNRIEGLPQKLSDFKELQINSFVTNDGVKLSYWEAGEGKPLIFIPGWSANGAEYVASSVRSRNKRLARCNTQKAKYPNCDFLG